MKNKQIRQKVAGDVKKVTLGCFFILCFNLAPVFAEWEPDVRLTFDDNRSHVGQGSVKRNIATGPEGLVHVVWNDERNGAWQTFYKRSTNYGVTWSTDTFLTNPNNSTYPSIAVSGMNVHVTWRGAWEGYEIYHRGSTDGGINWGPETRLTYGPNPNSHYCSSVSVSGTNVHVVYGETLYGGWANVWYRRSTDGGTSWEPAICLNNNDSLSGWTTVSARGTYVHVVWSRFISIYEKEVHYRRSIDGGASWEPKKIIVTGAGTHNPTMESWADSVVHVVFERAGYIEHLRSLDAGISWSTPKQLTYVYYDVYPTLSVSGSMVHVVWFVSVGNSQIYYKRSTDYGVTWEADTCLTYTPGDSWYPSIAAADSMVHVVWQDPRDYPAWPEPDEIYYKRNPTGNTGVEEKTDTRCQISAVRLKIRPNPFVFYTTVHGYEKENFALYDISGRLVSTCRGNRIGEGLCAGVYFVMPANKNLKSVRILKVR
jgi:hypothetical protein